MRPDTRTRSQATQPQSASSQFGSSAVAFAPLEPPLPRTDEALAFPAVSSFSPSMNFRVDLDIFRGPLDLLLYLVRKHELDVLDIPIALITDQYIQHLDVLQQMDVNSVGDFIELASLLIEIKSRMALPQVEENAEEIDDPRDELVERLLDYKRYKDAASMLEESGQQWQQQYTRLANDLPPRQIEPAEQPIREVEMWDLVSALGRVMQQAANAQPPCIVYDDTPINVYMQRLHDRLVKEERVSFSSMFQPGMHKAAMIGVFLATLELARNYNVVVEQVELHSEIWLKQGDEFQPVMEISEVFSTSELPEPALPGKPR